MKRSGSLLVLCVLLIASGASAQPRGGPEFRVNSFTTNNQYAGEVAVGASGRFVISYQFATAQFVPVFDAAGSLAGYPTTFNFNATGRSNVDDAGPNFVIVFPYQPTPPGPNQIFFEAFRTGFGIGYQVSTYTTADNTEPDVAADGAGAFVVVWTSDGHAGDDAKGVFGRRFSSDGHAVTDEFRVNTSTSGAQDRPAVARNDAGAFVVVWQEAGSGADPVKGILGQRFAAAGTPSGGAFRVNTVTTFGQYTPAVAMDGAGNFVVAWSSYGEFSGNGGYNWTIHAQRFGASGAPIGGPARVSATTSAIAVQPSVAALPLGFVVAWMEDRLDGSSYNVFGRRFGPLGAPSGAEFRVNTYTSQNQVDASVAAGAGGSFVVAWRSFSQDGSLWGVYAQKFCLPGDADGNGILSVSDILYLINHLYAGGPAPLGCADADGSLAVNVADILYLINHLYAGGPAPV